MSVNDELGTRIKNNYENIPKIKLMRRCPVIIRIDGREYVESRIRFDESN